MNKLLIVVDMQYDFVNGALANKDAEKIVPEMCKYLGKWTGDICFTRDTHDENYLNSSEGLKLPIKHCIKNTRGHDVLDELIVSSGATDGDVFFIDKPTFGYTRWDTYGIEDKYDEIVVCGTCTDICVVSNVLILKALFPEIKITVLSNLCAGLSKEKHKAALETMRSCQVEVQ